MWCCRSWTAALYRRQAISFPRNIIVIVSTTAWPEGSSLFPPPLSPS
jgi:hypothetical protein